MMQVELGYPSSYNDNRFTGFTMDVLRIMTNGPRKTRIQALRPGRTRTSTSTSVNSFDNSIYSPGCARYFTKFEKYAPSKRFPLVNISLRGSDGPIECEELQIYKHIKLT